MLLIHISPNCNAIAIKIFCATFIKLVVRISRCGNACPLVPIKLTMMQNISLNFFYEKKTLP